MVLRGKTRQIIALAATLACGYPALGQLSANDLEKLRQEGQKQGWTFDVGPTSATGRNLSELCGLVPPANRPLVRSPGQVVEEQPIVGLPSAYDWRTVAGCPPVRNQGGCGSCWAFATAGAVECAIRIKDGINVDLSEQWLVSCNTYYYGCSGGWWVFDFFTDTPDKCGKIGAELEADFPYTGTDSSCACTPRTYRLTSYSDVNPYATIPAVDAIKQAIMNHGPVAVGVRVDSAFSAYQNGVFNASSSGAINHGVVLVGWDDSQGPAGVWFLRNSWGSGWGESGYMRIAYGCSSVGYGASYVDYAGAGIVTSVDQLTVAENGTATFQVHLMGQPSSNVTVSVARLTGDSDISVSSGASLTFTPSNWKTDQTVTLAAAADSDDTNGQATIRLSATGLQSHDIVVTEDDDDVLVIQTDLASVIVPENSTASVRVKLSAAITQDTTVTCTRIAGDSNLSVSAGATRTFTASNWSTYQTITFFAADDADTTNGTATFRLSATGLPNVDIVVAESDDDVVSIVTSVSSATIAEGSTATFDAKLNASPGPYGLNVSVARLSGDSSISVQSGALLSFTSSNWNTYQHVTLQAATDPDLVNGQAVIRCSASGSPNADVTVTEQDTTQTVIQTDKMSLTIPEGGMETFNVRLGWQPASDVTVRMTQPVGDVDIDVLAGSVLVFSSSNWNVYQTVTMGAADDNDALSSQATVQCYGPNGIHTDVTIIEQDDDVQSIVLETQTLELDEGASGSVRVRLGTAPTGSIQVSTARASGDTDLAITAGAVLTFDASNWNTFLSISLAAGIDSDTVDGQAIFRCSAPGATDVALTVTERDPDVVTIETDQTQVSVPEQETATFAVRLSHQPVQDVTVHVVRAQGDSDIHVVSGATLVFTSANWSTYQQVTLSAADDADMVDGTATIQCSANGSTAVSVTAVEQDQEVSPYEPDAPTSGGGTNTTSGTSVGTGSVSAPACGGGVGVGLVACTVIGLMFCRQGARRRHHG